MRTAHHLHRNFPSRGNIDKEKSAVAILQPAVSPSSNQEIFP
jgi:hypothetical protein